MIDHGYQREHARGNTGRGFKVGILDVPPFDSHEVRMGSIVNRVAPGADVLWSVAVTDDPGPLWELAKAGCCAIAMPVTFGGSYFGRWPQYLHTLSENGVMVFAGTGNGVATTAYPATDPCAYAVGGVSAVDGAPIGRWSSANGKFNVGCVSGDTASSGAAVMAASIVPLWMGYAVHRYPDPRTWSVRFWDWLGRTGWRIKGRHGFVPNCDRLGE